MRRKKWTVQTLKDFELLLITMFEAGKIRCPLHLSGGNEEDLIEIFKHIKPQDYVFSTHRNHYHYLLKGGDPDNLISEILGKDTGINHGQSRSMNICDPSINFFTSAIVGGNCAVAVGVAMALKKVGSTAKGGAGKEGTAVGKSVIRKNKAHVWCFVGDGAEDSGHFVEAVRFGLSRSLPLTFIVEDNDRSTDSTKQERWHGYQRINSRNVLRYSYTRTYPHVGIGKHVIF